MEVQNQEGIGYILVKPQRRLQVSVLPPKSMMGARGPKNEAPKRAKRPTRVPSHTSGLRGQINAWMVEAFTKMGVPELIGQVPWNMSKRMTAARGRAGCVWKDGKATEFYMEFSVSLMKLSDDNGKRQCVFHECAHVVTYHKGTYIQGSPHGAPWKTLMYRAGLEPERCHKVERLKSRKMKKFAAHCGCKKWELSAQKRRKIKLNEMFYTCKKCGEKLVLER